MQLRKAVPFVAHVAYVRGGSWAHQARQSVSEVPGPPFRILLTAQPCKDPLRSWRSVPGGGVKGDKGWPGVSMKEVAQVWPPPPPAFVWTLEPKHQHSRAFLTSRC